MWKGQERGQGPYYGLEFAFAKCQKGKNEGPDKLCQLQVNLCQKLSILNQLTHNMSRDCSLNSPKIQVHNMLCTNIVLNVKKKRKNNFSTQHVLNLYFSGNSMSNLLHIVG